MSNQRGLRMEFNPIPIIAPYTERKSQAERVFRPDEINSTAFKNPEVKDYSLLNENSLRYLHKDYLYSTNEDI